MNANANANGYTAGNGNRGGSRFANMSDEELSRLIFHDSVIRQACEFVTLMIVARRRNNQCNVVCEVNVQGRQVSAAYGREMFGTCTVPHVGVDASEERLAAE